MSFVNEPNNTLPEKTSVFIDNKEYVFNSSWIERLKKVNTEVTEEYIKSLLDYLGSIDPAESPVYISRLLEYDYYNKLVFSANGGMSICQYDYDGNFIREFLSLDDLMELKSTTGYLFSLKSQENSGLQIKRSKMDFFGAEITPMFTKKSYKYSFISSLNLWMKEFVSYEDKNKWAKRYYESEFCEVARKYYSAEEYLIKSKQAFLFSLGSVLHFGFSQRYKNKQRKDNLSENEYKEQLDKLLKRYTHNNISLFQKVENLNDFKSQVGIYILCLPEIKGYYIGKTSQSLKTRITNHWVSPKSNFDRYYGNCDVQEIYVMVCNELDDYTIDELEIDCIATIGRKFALNCLSGGDYIISINAPQYDENRFSMSEDFLVETKEKLVKIKEIANKNIQYQKDAEKVRKHQATTYEEYLGAVKDNYNNLFYVPVEFRDEQICLEAIYYHWYSKKPSFLSNSQKYIYDFLGLIPKNSYTDKFVKQLIRELTGNFKTKILFDFLPLESVSAENLAYIVANDYSSFDLIPENKKDQDFYNEVSIVEGRIFSKIPKQYLTEEVYMNLVIAMPSNIKKVPSQLLDRDFYVEATENNPRVLKYIPDDIMDNEIIELALAEDSSVIEFVGPKNSKYPQYALDAVKDDWKVIKYIPDEYKTKEMYDVVSPFGKRALKYFPKK